MLESARPQRVLAALILAALLAVYAVSGMRGVGFGSMWDESHQQDGLRTSVKTLSIWPNGYYYGGLYYWPGYVLLAPHFLGKLPQILGEMRDMPSRPFSVEAHPILAGARQAALDDLAKPDFVDRTRRVFVCVTALTILWIFGASWSATGSPWAALAAASALGLSWEHSYHGRWIAVDCMLAGFAALVLLLVNLALSAKSATRELLLFRAASVAAGLGLGSKMPGVFLIVPVLVAMSYSARIRSQRAWLAHAVGACAIMFAVFVATTPGVVLDPLHYADDMFRVTRDYNRIADDNAYCEASFALRLGKIAGYWLLVLFSPYLAVSLVFAALVLIGGLVGVRERQPKVMAAAMFLFVYVGFVSMQRLLIVRNLMATLPALALLCAVGVRRCSLLASRWRFGRGLLATGFVAISLLNAHWIWYAASTVSATTDETILTDLRAYLRTEKAEKFYISPAIFGALTSMPSKNGAPSALVSSPWRDAHYVVLYLTDVPDWKANTPKFARYFASLHANYDYYPGLLNWWKGKAIVVMSKDRVTALGVKSPSN